jgi:hypothetical protein
MKKDREINVHGNEQETRAPGYRLKRQPVSVDLRAGLTAVWIQWAGGCRAFLTASSMTPSLWSRPGQEHMEKPPTFSTPGMKKSTLRRHTHTQNKHTHTRLEGQFLLP